MKTHTNNYKNQIKLFGREIDSKITYGNTELGNEDLNSVTPRFQSSLLKSAMKQLDIDSNVEIPVNTEINYQFGVKVGNAYEYVDFGNYIVYSSEKQEDTNSYKIICYDKMLYAMKPYETLGITYPITVRNYLIALCTKLGLAFANSTDTFANYNQPILQELYLDSNGGSLGYTYRDVLDELAQVTGSVICINDDDELEVRYVTPAGQDQTVEGTTLYITNASQDGILYEGTNNITQTNNDLPFVISLTYADNTQGIDEEYLKDVNVNFGEKFGPLNSIVFTRAGGSDSVYIQDQESITLNGLCEIKIEDNQILNLNNRADFLPDLLTQLDGLEYYYNDYSSTGITYYDILDKYNVTIDGTTYNCIMFNDEINITQGLEENVYTEVAEETETEYQYASKDDRQRNQAYIIAKKNDAEIQALASKVVDISNTITGTGTITLQNAYEGILHRLEIVGNISSLYPSETLEPNNNLVPIDVFLVVDNDKYLLGFDTLNYVSSEQHDTFVYEDGKCWIERINGTTEQLDDLTILVKSNSVISIEYFTNCVLTCQYLLDNEYTSTFANQVEVTSELNLLGDTLEAKVSQVADEDGNVTSASIILAVNNDNSVAEINANKINLNGAVTANENFKILDDGSMETKNATFSGLINGGAILVNGNFTEQDPYINVEHPNSTSSAPIGTTIWSNGISCYDYSMNTTPVIRTETESGYAELSGDVVNAYGFINVSSKEEKKDFENLRNGIDIIKGTDVYKYNYKEEKNNTKKHIGLVIDKDSKSNTTPEEIISKDGNGVDLYAMVSVTWKAIQEQQEHIEKLQQKIENLKKEMK